MVHRNHMNGRCCATITVAATLCASWAWAGGETSIPVSGAVNGQPGTQIGTITADDNNGDGSGVEADFELSDDFAFLDNWYNFRWINIVLEQTVNGVPVDLDGDGEPDAPIPSSQETVPLPALDPQPGPCAGCPAFNDGAPYYYTDDEHENCEDLNGNTICVPGESSSFADDRGGFPAGTVIKFRTYLCAESETDPDISSGTICVLASFDWTYTQDTGAQDITASSSAPDAGPIDTALGQAAPPGFAGYSTSTSCEFEECPEVTDCVSSDIPGTFFSPSSWTLDGAEIGETFPDGVTPEPGVPQYDTTYPPSPPNDWHWSVTFEWKGQIVTVTVWIENFDPDAEIEVEVVCSAQFPDQEVMLMIDINNDQYTLMAGGLPLHMGQWSQYPFDIPPDLGFFPAPVERQNFLDGPPASCNPDAGPCAVANGSPGCDDVECCVAVCTIDSFCCDVEWDPVCANTALEICDLGCLTCPPGALDEGEPCGDDANGGCNATPNAYVDAADGGLWCGTAWADNGVRDTDWHLVTLETPSTLTAILNAEFDGVVFLVGGIPACEPIALGNSSSSNCEPGVVSADLEAGQYVVFVSTGTPDGGGLFDGFPCGTDNDYTLQIDITPIDCPCVWDLNGDCVVGPGDLASLLAQWGAPYGPTDLANLLAEWGCSF